ncbi:hypothetical protein GQ457_14G007740 [Hibiscus cannabinus]
MNCAFISWNTRGLGRPEKRRSVSKTINSCRANVVFLQETKISCLKSVIGRQLCGKRFEGCVVSPATGSSGGLMSLWACGFFKLESQIILNRVIILIGRLSINNEKCGLVNVYAPNDRTERGAFFEELTILLYDIQLPVIVGGDFNVVKCREEKIGSSGDSRSMGKFNEFIRDNELVDLPMGGKFFTWFRREPRFTASVLDRFLVSPEVIVWFPNLSQLALPRKLSDHCPIFLREVQIKCKHRPFKWFTHWGDNSEFCDMMSNTLLSKKGVGIGVKLKTAKAVAKSWVELENLKVVETVESLENRISCIEQVLASSSLDLNEEAVLKAEAQDLSSKLWNLYRRDEREWMQKSRLRWFKEGDKNTRFFHLSASLRGKVNYFQCIKIDNQLISDQAVISKVFEEHFKASFNDGFSIPIKDFVGDLHCCLEGLEEMGSVVASPICGSE